MRRRRSGCGQPAPDPGRVRQAARRPPPSTTFVERLPLGYRTPLADAPMSGGEAQRLGLARALHAERLLILDDATSSLDTATEHQITRAVTEAGDRRTRLVVTHRAATAARADLVAWLEAAGCGRWGRTAGCGPTPATAPCSRGDRRGGAGVIRQFRPARRAIWAALRRRPRGPGWSWLAVVSGGGAAGAARRSPHRPRGRRRVPGRPGRGRVRTGLAALGGAVRGRRGTAPTGPIGRSPGVVEPFRDDLLRPGRRRRAASSRGRRWPPRHLAGGPAHPPGRDRPGHLRRAW